MQRKPQNRKKALWDLYLESEFISFCLKIKMPLKKKTAKKTGNSKSKQKKKILKVSECDMKLES